MKAAAFAQPGLAVGVVLPSVTEQRLHDFDVAAAARHAEDVGLDSVWHGDHLAVGMPVLDCAIALAVAAVATERITIGASVFVPAIRPLAWAAKQIASLQYVSRGRLVLGVGSGGGPEQWAAAGVDIADRGRRTDTALELLPRLLAGETVRLEDEPGKPDVDLAPAVPMPPVWVGNASPVAIRRAARLADGWFPSVLPVRDVARGVSQLTELANTYQRPQVTVTVGLAGAIGSGDGVPTRDEIAAQLGQIYGIPADQAAEIPVTGSPAEVAEQLAAYHAAGARHVVIGFSGGDWRRQCELLAEARAALG